MERQVQYSRCLILVQASAFLTQWDSSLYRVRSGGNAAEVADPLTYRHPAAPARRSQTAQRKASTHHLENGTLAHSFRTLLDELSTVVRNTCRALTSGMDARSFQIVTTANPKQAHAMQLLQTITL